MCLRPVHLRLQHRIRLRKYCHVRGLHPSGVQRHGMVNLVQGLTRRTIPDRGLGRPIPTPWHACHTRQVSPHYLLGPFEVLT
jgi:hypothetical protein